MPVMPLVEGDEIPRIGKEMAAVRKGQVAPVQDFSGVLEALLQLEGCKSMKSYQPPIYFFEEVAASRKRWM